MAKKLSQKKLDEMFKLWVERQSLQYISRKCSVARTTVRKYMKKQDWAGRLEEIQKKAVEKQDEGLVSALAANLKIVTYAKGKIVELIMAGDRVSKTPASDLDKMIRLELLLRGEADSRSETITNDLRDVPTNELLEMQKELHRRGSRSMDGDGDTG